jgi:hypothetical protein
MRPRKKPATRKKRSDLRLARLRALLPDGVPGVDPDDLDLILWSLSRSPDERRYFIYPDKGGGYSF